jgi:hypothetical protein
MCPPAKSYRCSLHTRRKLIPKTHGLSRGKGSKRKNVVILETVVTNKLIVPKCPKEGQSIAGTVFFSVGVVKAVTQKKRQAKLGLLL